MSGKPENTRIAAEMEKRLDEFTMWAIANWPDRNAPLTTADFDPVRRKIASLRGQGTDIEERNAAIPEPADSGPQYVNVTPSPWP
jgi:hypothetical protein